MRRRTISIYDSLLSNIIAEQPREIHVPASQAGRKSGLARCLVRGQLNPGPTQTPDDVVWGYAPDPWSCCCR